jgi:hypothetical protein
MHESDTILGIRPSQAGDDDVAFFSLVVIYRAGYTHRTPYFVETLPIVANRIPG